MLVAKYIFMLLQIVLFAVAFWGLGSAATRERLPAMRILAGMAAYLFYAGILNFLRMGYLPLLMVPLIFGLYLSFVALRKNALREGFLLEQWKEYRASAALLSALGLLCAFTAAFPEAFNLHDDYQKYFIQPTKLLATGSIYGSPLSTVGKETFGGQAAFQALFIGFGGVRAINVFDAVFCLLLAVFLLTDLGREKRNSGVAILAAILMVTINAQYVNVSSIYSFVCFAIGAVILHQRILSEEQAGLRTSSAITIGVFYASMLALKTTFALFAIAHFPLVVMTLLMCGHGFGKVLKWSLLATATGMVAILPWVVELASLGLAGPGHGGMVIPTTPNWSLLSALLVNKSMFYGGNPLAYLALLTGAGMCTLALLMDRKSTANILSSAAALVVALLVLVYAVAVVGNQQHLFNTAFRYSVPFMVAMTPVALLIAAGTAPLKDGAISPMQKIRRAMAYLIPGALLVVWLPARLELAQQSSRCGSYLAFSELACSQPYRDYNRYVLGGVAEKRIKGFQALIPEGATVVAWINYAHLMDFERNKVIEVDPAGLSNSWAQMPDAEYLMLDIAGYATRRKPQLEQMLKRPDKYNQEIWRASLDFIDYLEKKVGAQAELGRGQDIVVYKITVPKNRDFKSAMSDRAGAGASTPRNPGVQG